MLLVLNCLAVGAVRRQAPSEHMTPKDVVISAAPAEASLAQYMKGTSYHLNLCNVFFREFLYNAHLETIFFLKCMCLPENVQVFKRSLVDKL